MTTTRGDGLDRQAAELGRYVLALVVANIGLWTPESENLLRGYMYEGERTGLFR